MLAWLENTPVGVWVDVSPWAYPFLLTVHGLGMAVVVGLTVVIALRVLGFPGRLPLGPYRKLMPILWIAFLFNFASGVVLYTTDAQALTFNLSYQIKMASIVVGLILLWRLQKTVLDEAARVDAAGEPAADGAFALPVYVPDSKAKALALVVVLIWWLSVIVSGRLVAYLAAAA